MNEPTLKPALWIRGENISFKEVDDDDDEWMDGGRVYAVNLAAFLLLPSPGFWNCLQYDAK